MLRVNPSDPRAGTVYLGEWQTKVRDLVASTKSSDVRYRGVIFTPNARPTAGDPKRHPCPYEATSQVMPDVLFVRHPPCPGYQLDWFCPN